MTETSGKQCVLWTLDRRCFPRLRLGKHRRSRVHKTHCFPRSQSISDKYLLGRGGGVVAEVTLSVSAPGSSDKVLDLDGNRTRDGASFGFVDQGSTNGDQLGLSIKELNLSEPNLYNRQTFFNVLGVGWRKSMECEFSNYLNKRV